MGQKKRLQPKLEPDDWAEAKSKVGQKAREEDMPSAMSVGSGRRKDPQLSVAIRGPREEEFGARLSDRSFMNSTGLVGNWRADMSAMQFCRVLLEKEMASPEGRAKPYRDRPKAYQEGTQRDAREEEKRRAVMCCIYGRIAHSPIRFDVSQICKFRMWERII